VAAGWAYGGGLMLPQLSEARPERPAWERMRGESAKAYESFRRFRDGGPHRTLAGCRSIERRWSWRWRWAERAGAWDSELWRRRSRPWSRSPSSAQLYIGA
jgi:hypothetical protein